MRTRKRQGWHRYINGITVSTTVVILFVTLPLYWMVLTSFKSNPASTALVSTSLNTSSYKAAFNQFDFGHAIFNSAIVSIISTALVLTMAALAGYALGRLPMRGKLPLLVALLMISVFPAVAVIAPLYLLMRSMNILNTYLALIIPYTAFNLPFAIWIIRNYMLGIPREMEETARIDGAKPLRTLWSVILPQARPGLFTAGIFTFTACWAEFLMALTFDSDTNMHTIPVTIGTFGAQYTVPYGVIFAAASAASLPIAILVLVFRKNVVSGLTAGAVKG